MAEYVRTGFWRRLWRHKAGHWSMAVLMGLILLALAAPIIASHSPVDTDLSAVRQPPSTLHWLGTDELGRDIFSRLLYGARVSLTVGFCAILLSTVVGLLFGFISGYFGGIIDNLLMRLVDGLLSLPTLVLVLALQALGTQSLWNVVMVIAFANWMQTARLVRTEFISIKQKAFVKTAVTTGTTDSKIIIRYILPNCMPSVIVLATINVGHAIVTEAALSFLGLGIPPHLPSWGNMLIGGQRSILLGNWWITLFPGLMIIGTVLAVNFVGDAVRDALDPLSVYRKPS